MEFKPNYFVNNPIMLASNFLLKLKSLNKEDLLKIKGVGEVLADNYEKFLSSPRFNKLVLDFQKLETENKGLEIKNSTKKPSTDQKLTGQTICITGTFELSRSQISEKLEYLGAKVVDTVSSKTTILLAGESAGSKLQKAKSLNIKIVNDLKELL